MVEHCAICGCELQRARDTYARPTIEGRSGASKHHLDLPFQNLEHLLEVVPVRRRTSAGRDEHVDQSEPPRRLFAAEKNRVGAADNATSNRKSTRRR